MLLAVAESGARKLFMCPALLAAWAIMVALGLSATRLGAQERRPGETAVSGPSDSLTVSGLLSIQPGTGPDRPYLDVDLGNSTVGGAISADIGVTRIVRIGLEASTTTAMTSVQTGRFVRGEGPTTTRHRDTLLSVLLGLRVAAGNGSAVEVKAGPSLVLGTPDQGGQAPYGQVTGKFAFTVGVDAELPIGPRIALVPSFRTSFVKRGPEAYYVGLGDRILRCGVGVRFQLPKRSAGASTKPNPGMEPTARR
jgi:hypothetical protein